jgi:hypothetical protein
MSYLLTRKAGTASIRQAMVAAGAAAVVACQADMPLPAEPKMAEAVLAQSPAGAGGVSLGAPLFELDFAPDGSLIAAVASAGIVEIRAGTTDLMAALPGANGVAAIGGGNAYVVTGGSTDPGQILPTSRKLFRVSNGGVRMIADLWAFEQLANPDDFWHDGPTAVESNPFDVAVLDGGRVLVADAAANTILEVDANGAVDWVAVLTPRDMPAPAIDPQPVPTSLAIGPDGAYYVGELTGFPGYRGASRVWRIAPDGRHVQCPSSACTLVASGFTSIIDLAFAPNGTLYVLELDEANWLGMEAAGFAKAEGGTLNACNIATGVCSVVASSLALPTAVAVDKTGGVWIAEQPTMLFAGSRVRRLP